METELIELKKGAALGIKVILPNAPLLIIRAEKGYIACGYLNPKTIEKLKDPAAITTGVRTFSQLLSKKITYASKKARSLGINKNMTGRQALEKMV